MRKKQIILLLTLLATGLIFAQTNLFSPSNYPPQPPRDGRIPPPLNLDAAYGKAIHELGEETNRFHCVSATCLQWLTRLGSSEEPKGTTVGWTFVFLDTNGAPKNVYVYFDKASTVLIEDPKNIGR
jgi:hypothetical protein